MIGENIKKAREKLGLSQDELAKRLNVDRTRVSQYERGVRNPKIETAAHIAKALDVPVNSLIDIAAIIDVPVSTSRFKIEDIPIEKISPSPMNKYGIRDIDELSADIENNGLLHNLVIKSQGNGNYQIISGERRYRACMSLYKSGNNTYSTLPCKVETPASPLEEELILLMANATSRVLTDWEKTMQAGRIKEILQDMKRNGHKFKGRMRNIVADILKISPAQMGRMESINKHLSKELTESYNLGVFGITTAYELSKMSESEQADIFERYKETGKITMPLEVNEPKPAETEQNEHNKQEVSEELPPISHKEPSPSPPPANKDNSQSKKADTWAKQHEERIDAMGQEIEEMLESESVTAGVAKTPRFAHVRLTDKGGSLVEIAGNLAIIAAVDTTSDKFDGAFSAGSDVSGLDYATLAKVICVECLKKMNGDTESIEILRHGLSKLFDKGFE